MESLADTPNSPGKATFEENIDLIQKIYENCLALKSELRSLEVFTQIVSPWGCQSPPSRGELSDGKIERVLEVQQQQHDKLQNMLRWARVDAQEQEHHRSELTESISDEYRFLRSQWVSFRRAPCQNSDDQIDKLSKTVAMLRARMTRTLQKERTLSYSFTEEQVSIEPLDDQFLQSQQRRLESAMMRAEEYENRLIDLEQKYTRVLADNQELTTELTKTKEKLRMTENNLIQVSKREHEVTSKLGQLKEQLDKLKRKNKAIYKGQDFEVQICAEGIEKVETQTKRKLEDLLDYLVLNHQDQENEVPQSGLLDCSTLTMDDVCRKWSGKSGFRSPDQYSYRPLLTSRSRGGLSNKKEDLGNIKFKRTQNSFKENCPSAVSGARLTESVLLERGFYTKLNLIEGQKSRVV